MQVLEELQLYAKLRKFSLYLGRIHYLWYNIYEEYISVDTEKLRVVMEWPTPRNVL